MLNLLVILKIMKKIVGSILIFSFLFVLSLAVVESLSVDVAYAQFNQPQGQPPAKASPPPGQGKAAAGTPVVGAGAGQNPSLGNVVILIQQVGKVVGLITPIIFALAIIYFFWGLAKFVLAAGDDEARSQGKKIMLWGVVALFVMVSVYGLIKFLGNALDVEQGLDVELPNIPMPTTTGIDEP